MNKIMTLSLLLLCSLRVLAQEMVQWRGENRDGIYHETGLLKEWPAGGPKLLWHYDALGDGHSSACVTRDRVYTSGMDGDKGFVIALDHSGKLAWRTEYGQEWTENWNGLHSTPLFYKDKLYILSAFGRLVCLNASDGKVLWAVELFKEYDGENIQWGITENLLIDDHKLYCTPGGKTANVIALDPDTGKLIWKGTGNGEKSAYCSPTIIKLPQRKVLVTHTANSIIGVDAGNGSLLWKHEHTNKWSVHPNTPIYSEGYLYCFSGYGKGGVMLKVSDDGKTITEVWKDSRLDNQMGGAVLLNGRIYGSGQNSRTWLCLDWKTGRELYAEKIAGNGNIVFADGMLYCYGDNGEVCLVKPTDNGFSKVSSFKVPYGANQHWAHLVVSGKKLYVRHGTSLMVYSLAAN